jgi:hypothetical protein
VTFGRQHPADLAQHLVRVGAEFQCVRQQHQVHAAAVEWQRLGLAIHARHPRRWRAGQIEQRPHRGIAGIEQVDRADTAELHRDLAEKRRPHGAQGIGLDRQQRTPRRLREPGAQTRAARNGIRNCH